LRFSVEQRVRCKTVAKDGEHGSRGIYYQAAASVDIEVLMFAVMICRVYRSVKLQVSNKSNYQSKPIMIDELKESSHGLI
jgi:hypothetical protein